MKLRCPCGAKLEASISLAGKIARCPTCNLTSRLPSLEELHRLTHARGVEVNIPKVSDQAQEEEVLTTSSNTQLLNDNLLNCPDCNGVVSKQAFACPHCGRPLRGKEAVARLTVGRVFVQANSFWGLDIFVDGKKVFILQNGEKGMTEIEPGNHLIRAVMTGVISERESSLDFSIEAGEHSQFSVDPSAGFWMNTISISPCVFRGFD